MKLRELKPTNGRKSFYGKAIIGIDDEGNETLFSYFVPIITRKTDGTLVRLYNDWTSTTGVHIKSFCGLTKKEFMEL